jgi:hypothetical protein
MYYIGVTYYMILHRHRRWKEDGMKPWKETFNAVEIRYN